MKKRRLFCLFAFLGIGCYLSFYVLVSEKGDSLLVALESKKDSYAISDNLVKIGKSKISKNTFLTDFTTASGGLPTMNCSNGTVNYVGTGCTIVDGEDNYSVILYGDVNGDGIQSITDMVLIAMQSKDNETLTNDNYKRAADVNQNFSVSLEDAEALALYVLKVEEVPVEKETNPTTPDEPEVLSKITLSKTSLTLNINEHETITASVDKTGVTIMDWSSSNTNVATVDSSGNVTAIGGGSAVITVKASDGSTASVTINVTVVVPVTGISIDKSTLEVEVGSSGNLIATISPGDATDKSVTWSSDNVSVASVDNTGKVTGVAAGTATITAVASGFTASTVVTVKEPVVAVTGVSLSNASGSKYVSVEKSLTLAATVSPSDATDKSVIWSSSDTSVATVKNGKVTGVARGAADITVKTVDGSKTATYGVVVRDGAVVLINPSHQKENVTCSDSTEYSTEKDSMYKFSWYLKGILEDNGYIVERSPRNGSIESGDGCWDSSDGTKWSTCGALQVKYLIDKYNTTKTVYIALHSNAGSSGTTCGGTASGPVVLYYADSSTSKSLSDKLCTRLKAAYKNKGVTDNRSSCSDNASGSSDEAKKYYTNGGKGAAVLIEVGFHDNEANQKFIEKRTALANAIMKGINDYFG